jgi:hypothetical protein
MARPGSQIGSLTRGPTVFRRAFCEQMFYNAKVSYAGMSAQCPFAHLGEGHMIHHIYRKVELDVSTSVADVESRWQCLKAAVSKRDAGLAALLESHGVMELDAARDVVTLVVVPSLFDVLEAGSVLRLVVCEAVVEVFGSACVWSLVPGTWATMTADGALPAALYDARTHLERLVQRTSEGVEFWTRADLATVLGHLDQDEFSRVLVEAQMACARGGHRVEVHFVLPAQPIGPLGTVVQTIGVLCLSRLASELTIEHAEPSSTRTWGGRALSAKQVLRPDERVTRRVYHSGACKTRDGARELKGEGPSDIGRDDAGRAARRCLLAMPSGRLRAL